MSSQCRILPQVYLIHPILGLASLVCWCVLSLLVTQNGRHLPLLIDDKRELSEGQSLNKYIHHTKLQYPTGCINLMLHQFTGLWSFYYRNHMWFMTCQIRYQLFCFRPWIFYMTIFQNEGGFQMISPREAYTFYPKPFFIFVLLREMECVGIVCVLPPWASGRDRLTDWRRRCR